MRKRSAPPSMEPLRLRSGPWGPGTPDGPGRRQPRLPPVLERPPRALPPPGPRWAGPEGRGRAQTAIRRLLAAEGLAGADAAEVARRLTPERFAAHHLRSLLEQVYRGSVYQAVTDAVPVLGTWRQPAVARDYWLGEEGIARAQAATARLLAALGISDADPQQIVAAAPPAVFAWGGLAEMLAGVYAGSVGAALRAVCPALPPWRLERVPYGYWQGLAGTTRAQAATRQLLGELSWGGLALDVLARRVTKQIFYRHGLRGMLNTVYQGSPYAALQDLFPDVQPWQMGTTPMGYWTGTRGRDHARRATRWLLRQLGVSDADPVQIAAVADYAAFSRWGLDGMLDRVYHHSRYAALAAVVPGLQPWHLPEVPVGYWAGAEGRNHACAATRWLLAQHGLSQAAPAVVAAALTQDDFTTAGLSGMLQTVYGSSPYAALADLLPDLAPWQMGRVPAGYWQGAPGRERAQAATRWLLAQRGLTALEPAQIAAVLDHTAFVAAGLGGMLRQVYGGSPYAALVALFPALRPWQMGVTPTGYWQGAAGRDHARAALRWLIAQLGLLDEAPSDIAGLLDRRVFAEAGLGGMVHIVYGNSPYAAVADLFPAVQPWQMGTGVPPGYWQGATGREHARAATRWLLAQHRGAAARDRAAPEQSAAPLTADHFVQAGLGGMLQIIYRGSAAAAVDDADARDEEH